MSEDYLNQGDGTSYTLLLAENSGPLTGLRNMDSFLPSDLSFGLNVLHLDDAGSVPLNPTTGPLLGNVGAGSITGLGNSKPNSAVDGPRPSSGHNDLIHVAFTDGRATSFSDSVDSNVYIRLLTSSGQTVGEGILDPNDL